MSAADAREELEAYVWRLFARRSTVPAGQLVESVLAAADKYAAQVAAGSVRRVTEETAGRAVRAEAEAFRRSAARQLPARRAGIAGTQ
jgi:hypothetical protein